MTILDNGTRNQYTAAALQTVFAYAFEIFDKNDIAVEQNGTLLSEGTHYTVSDVGNDNGGDITLVTGADSGDVITIYRDMSLERLTDYQQSGDYLADEVNDDFDRLWAALQQNNNSVSRSIRASVDDAILNESNTELAVPSVRALKVLGFSQTGAIDYLSRTIATVGTLREYSTLAAAIIDIANISVGDVLIVKERSTGNGGGATWDAVDATIVIEDEFSIVTGDASISFVLRIGQSRNIKEYGASESVANNDTFIQACIDDAFAEGGGDVIVPIPSTDWPTSANITVKKGVNLIFLGNNMRGELRNYLLPSAAVTAAIDTKEQSGVGLHQVAVDCTNLVSGSVGFNIKATQWLDARGCQAENVDTAGVDGWKIWVEATDSQGCYWNTYYKCGSQGNNNVGTAWRLLGQTTGAKRLTTQTFIDCGGIGCLTNLDIDHVGSGIVWNNINMESAGGNGVEVDNSSSGVVVTFIGGEINGNAGWGITGTSDVLAINLVDGANNTGGGTGDTDSNVIHQRGNVLLDDATRSGAKAYHLANYSQYRESVVSYLATDSITPNKGQIRVSGNGGAVTLTSNPQIENPVGNQPQTLIILGGSNTSTLTLVDGNGLRLGQDRKLDSESVLILSYSASFGDWIELAYHSKTTQTYTPTNVTTDRAFDANTVVITELADVVGTLITDLQSKGLIS